MTLDSETRVGPKLLLSAHCSFCERLKLVSLHARSLYERRRLVILYGLVTEGEIEDAII